MLKDIEALAGAMSGFEGGTVSAAELRSIRVPLGIYEQRESGMYMLRVRRPAGGVGVEQLRRMADVAKAYGNGILHITTRQEFQVHGVPLKSVLPALRSLAEGGLSTKGGGGNTVRNITACLDASVCSREIFDVAPHARVLTQYLLGDPLSFELPRKYKIAFSGCERDCAGATVNDVGFVARKRDGADGFAVYVGGGMGGKSRVASLLHDFVSSGEAHRVSEAIKRVFDKHGDRKNKHLARLRWLVDRIGLERFKELYARELEALRAEGSVAQEIAADAAAPPAPRAAKAESRDASSAYSLWRSRNVRPQKQSGFFSVDVPVPLGDLSAAQANALADIVAGHGARRLGATQSQNVVLRWVREGELPEIRAGLAAAGLAGPDPAILRGIVACAGASTCRLGICLSRGLAKAVRAELLGSPLTLDDLGETTIHISGCPNSCGRHPVGNIGLSGAARRIDGQMAPFYSVYIGGRTGEGQTRLGMGIGALPARNVPAFIRDLLVGWQCSTERSDFHAFIENGGMALARELLERHQCAPAHPSDKRFFMDWDSAIPFSLAGRGAGECSAGVFDMIELDLTNAREWLEAGRLYAAALAAARALLITRRLKPRNDAEAFEMFGAHFVAAGRVDPGVGGVVAEGARCAGQDRAEDRFGGTADEVGILIASVRLLYDSMDPSLRLPQEAEPPCCAPGDPCCCQS